jgi:23S rRNA (adenine-N6)-dimethyltransferase
VPAGDGWGWHRLVDEWAARVVAAARVRPGELVVDVGAGQGALTGHLVAAGARVVAVELHPGRARSLRDRFGSSVTVVAGDALTFRWPHRPFRVVANPSYAISTPLLRVLLAPGSRLVAADLVLQRAVVRRHAAGPAAGRWRARPGLFLPRNASPPVPRVDSAVLVIRRR